MADNDRYGKAWGGGEPAAPAAPVLHDDRNQQIGGANTGPLNYRELNWLEGWVDAISESDPLAHSLILRLIDKGRLD
jgi:hypothetical protein